MTVTLMATSHRIVFGDCKSMREIRDDSVHLMVTSPPYYNAPFDYPGLFKDYDEFLGLMHDVSCELYRVLAPGRVACLVTDDMLVDGVKYPVVADVTRLMMEAGFRYRDRIVWVKPKGYVRISRRSGVGLQHPYPMYFYPDNIQESILLFQNGEFDYGHLKEAPKDVLESSKIDTVRLNDEGWNLTVWNITNVLPMPGRIEEGIAAFPEEIPKRLIKLFTMVGETVLDPFLGSGTTLRVARELGRKGIGYEIDLELKDVIKKKLGLDYDRWTGEEFIIEEREGARRLRKSLQTKVQQRRSVVKQPVRD